MKVKILNPEVVAKLNYNHGVFAATCYDTPQKYAEKVGKSCHESGHMSGSRCEYIKFQITDVDRGTAEQHLRHEIGVDVPFEDMDNYTFSDWMEKVIDVSPDQIVKNMASFRYIDKNGFEYATPTNVTCVEKANKKYQEVMAYLNQSREEIRDALIEAGIEKKRAVEDANFVLPRATTTSFTIGFTPEALISFCHKRMCTRAQEFIRQIAFMMRDEVAKYNEQLASEMVPHCEHLLWCPEKGHSCKRHPTRDELLDILRGTTA